MSRYRRRTRIAKPPTYAETSALRPAEDVAREKRDIAALRASMTRFASRHGTDALIALLKTDLAARGEDRQRLDALAQKFGPGGQASILDAGR